MDGPSDLLGDLGDEEAPEGDAAEEGEDDHDGHGDPYEEPDPCSGGGCRGTYRGTGIGTDSPIQEDNG